MCKVCIFKSNHLVWWAICHQISEINLLASNAFMFSGGNTSFKNFSTFSTFMSLCTTFMSFYWKNFAIFSLRGGPFSSHFFKSCEISFKYLSLVDPVLVPGLDEKIVVSACPLLPAPWSAKAFSSKVIASISLVKSTELLV